MQGYRKEWRRPRSPLTTTGNVLAAMLVTGLLLALLAWLR